MMLEQVRYRTKLTQSGIFLVRYRTKIRHAGMPDAGVSFLDADAQLCERVSRNTIFLKFSTENLMDKQH